MMRLQSMFRSDDKRQFNLALEELMSAPRDEAIQLLEELATESNGEFRGRALDGMARISPERAESLCVSHLDDPEWFVRVNAIHVLWQLECRTAAAAIAQRLESDPDETVRSWAAFSLGTLGDALVLPALATAAERDDGTDHEGRPIRDIAQGSINAIRTRLADESHS